MAHHPQIKGTDVRVGDIITVIGDGGGAIIFSDVRVRHIDMFNVAVENKDNKAEQDAFDPQGGFWKFYLVERPKKPLPTKIGSVVEADGVKYFRVLEDNENYAEWAYSDGSYITDISSELLSTYDFTVV